MLPGSMKVEQLSVLVLVFSLCLGEDKVADDIGVHQMERIAELLTPRECQDLHSMLTTPEENILQEIDRLSLEKNDLGVPDRVRRDIKMGKNINQDKSLSLKKYVEDYHKHVEAMHSSLIEPATDHTTDSHRAARDLTELSWSDLDLVIQREQLPPYSRRFLEGVWPLIAGVFLGFIGAFLIGGVTLLFSIHISKRDFEELLKRSTHHRRCHHRSSPSCSVDRHVPRDDLSLKSRNPTGRFNSFFPAFRLFKRFKPLTRKISGQAGYSKLGNQRLKR
ncbi:transmembrane and death domain protein 1 isoform X3 [Lepisosteus oculatus]|uniref:transmembrane and death domain protein 1 isoform X3 n=1 Tax=Lepisosteus oculatus TaxID=7918 RepID=UPI00371BAF47